MPGVFRVVTNVVIFMPVECVDLDTEPKRQTDVQCRTHYVAWRHTGQPRTTEIVAGHTAADNA